MIVGSYDLHLYCEAEIPDLYGDHRPAQFAGSRRSDAEHDARRAGWIVNNRTGEAWCPACAKRPRNRRVVAPYNKVGGGPDA